MSTQTTPKNIVKVFLLTLLSLLCVQAQSAYPDRPIGTMVAYGPGGATDFQARIATLASGKEKFLEQPVYILNKPGAGGRKGWNWFASKASKDGYMMAAYNVPHFIAQSIVFKTKYNINNLEPVGNWGADPAVLIVGKNSRFTTVNQLVRYARQNPGKVTVSGAGKFVGHHIAFLQFQKAINAKLTYIPAKGGVDAMRLVKGDKVMAGFNNLSDSTRSKNDLKILAVADLKRHEFLPNVPTMLEKGIDVDDSSVNFRGLMVPKGTPDSVIRFLSDRVPSMFADKKTVGKMKQTNSPIRVMNRDQVLSMWQERQVYLTKLLKGL